MRRRFLGVYREPRFSPGKVEDDRAILDETAEHLREAGAETELCDPDALPSADAGGDVVFAMCQSAEALAWLDRAARHATVVNSPESVRGCYRQALVERLEAAGIEQPRWAPAGRELPRDLGPGPWLKRGDVHAMEAADVRQIADESAWRAALEDFRQRGIDRAIAQEHEEGVVYKFYGVTGGFFRVFGLPEEDDPGARALGRRAAHALGLEVWGGDAVRRPDGSHVLLDLNDWPSFSRCRDEAAGAIARRLLEIAEERADDE